MSILRRKKENISDVNKDWIHLNLAAQRDLVERLEHLRRQRTHFVIQHNDKRKEIQQEFKVTKNADLLFIENSLPKQKAGDTCSPEVTSRSDSNRTCSSFNTTPSRQSAGKKQQTDGDPSKSRAHKVRMKDPETIKRHRNVINKQSYHDLLAKHRDRYQAQCLMAAALSVPVEHRSDGRKDEQSKDTSFLRSKTLFEEFESKRHKRRRTSQTRGSKSKNIVIGRVNSNNRIHIATSTISTSTTNSASITTNPNNNRNTIAVHK